MTEQAVEQNEVIEGEEESRKHAEQWG